MLRHTLLIAVLVAIPIWGQSPPVLPADWRTLFDAGKQAYAKGQYAEAAASLNAAAEAIVESADDDAPLPEILRYLSAVYRERGDLAQAEQVLQKAAEQLGAADPSGLGLAAILEEISAVQRAQGHSGEALATIEKAIEIRGSHPEAPRVDMARDLTTAAMLRAKGGDAGKAIEGLERAVARMGPGIARRSAVAARHGSPGDGPSRPRRVRGSGAAVAAGAATARGEQWSRRRRGDLGGGLAGLRGIRAEEIRRGRSPV